MTALDIRHVRKIEEDPLLINYPSLLKPAKKEKKAQPKKQSGFVVRCFGVLICAERIIALARLDQKTVQEFGLTGESTGIKQDTETFIKKNVNEISKKNKEIIIGKHLPIFQKEKADAVALKMLDVFYDKTGLLKQGVCPEVLFLLLLSRFFVFVTEGKHNALSKRLFKDYMDHSIYDDALEALEDAEGVDWPLYNALVDDMIRASA